MSRPWRLSRKVLVVASVVSPKPSAPSLHSVLCRIDPEDYAILTTVDEIPEGVAAGRPWLDGRYFFCGDPSMTKETASIRRPPTVKERLRRRIVRAATRLGARRLLLWIAVRTLESLKVFARTVRFIRAGLRAVEEAGCGLLLGLSDHGPAIIATYVVAKLKRTPYVYYLFDLYRGNRLFGPERWLARLLEGPMFRGAECIVTHNAAMAEYYRKRYGNRITLDVVHAVAPGVEFSADPAPYCPQPPYTISYTGSVGWVQWQAVANCVRAMDLLTDLPVALRIYCPRPAIELRDIVVGRSNVWLGSALPSEMPRIQRDATLLLVALSWHTSPPDVVATAGPSKLIEYLASGRPILIHAPAYADISRDARAHRLGLVVDRDDPATLAEAIRTFLLDPAAGHEYIRNAREMFRSRHHVRVSAGRLVSILDGKHAHGR